MCESFGEGPERLAQGEARTTRPRARGPNYSRHLHAGPARGHSEVRNSSDLCKGTDQGGWFLRLLLLHLSLLPCRLLPAPDFVGEHA
eukprot:1076285-Pyramimonas_sp.AAC.1